MLKILILSAALVAAAIAPADAACTQAQLAGTWRMYFQGHLGGTSFAEACTFFFTNTGAMQSSSCQDSLNRSATVTGSLKLKSAQQCNYTGSFKLMPGNDTNDVLLSTLSPDHNVLSAAAYDAPSTVGYAFTMIRIQ